MSGDQLDNLLKAYGELQKVEATLRSQVRVARKALEAMSKGLFSTKNAKLISEQALAQLKEG